MTRASFLLLTALFSAFLPGCDQAELDQQGKVKELAQEMEHSLKEIKDYLGKNVPPLTQGLQQKATDEIEKLAKIEYSVVELDQKLSREQLERKLSELGQDRWECFAVQPLGPQLRVFCRRRPKSYLRYMLRAPM